MRKSGERNILVSGAAALSAGPDWKIWTRPWTSGNLDWTWDWTKQIAGDFVAVFFCHKCQAITDWYLITSNSKLWFGVPEYGVRSMVNTECGWWRVRKIWSVENVERGKGWVWKVRSVENPECKKCGTLKMRRSVEKEESGKRGAWKVWRVGNVECGKWGVSLENATKKTYF